MPVTVRGTDILFNDGTTQSTAAGAVTTAAVLNATAGATYGAVGSYAEAANSSATDILVNNTAAGSVLRKRSTSGTFVSAGLSGTWRMMGMYEDNSSIQQAPVLWLRIS